MTPTHLTSRSMHARRLGRVSLAGLLVVAGVVSVLSGCVRIRDATIAREAPPLPRVAPPVVRVPAQSAGDVPASYMVLLPDRDGTVGQASMQTAAGRTTLNRPSQGADLAGGSQPFAVTESQIKRDFGAVLAARPPYPERFRLFYGTRDSALSRESMELVERIVRRSQQFGAAEITVIGHTDTRGSSPENHALGMRRARDFANLLVSKGVRAVNIEIGSDGETNPLVKTPDETAEARNRRIEVTLK